MRRKDRRHGRDRRIPAKFTQPVMNPFVDVVFLVLIYFVATYVVHDVQAGFDVVLPGDGPPPIEKTEPVPMIHVTAAEHGFFINNKRTDEDGLRTFLNQLAEIDTNQMVVITSTPKASHQRLVTVLDVCAESKLNKFAVCPAR